MVPTLQPIISTIFHDSTHEEFSFPLQVLNIKKVVSTGGSDRYRLIVSDGIHYMQSMLATQLNDLIVDDKLQRNGYIQVDKYVVNNVQGKRYLTAL
jgi:replication factor A1